MRRARAAGRPVLADLAAGPKAFEAGAFFVPGVTVLAARALLAFLVDLPPHG